MKMQNELRAFEAASNAANGQFLPLASARFEKRRASLNPFQIAYLDPQFRRRARATRYAAPNWYQRAHASVSSDRPFTLSMRIEGDPVTALLAMHAADGHLREYATRIAPMKDSAGLALLLSRCNDWVKPVRKVAFDRLADVLPRLDQKALMPLCLFVLSRGLKWGLGGAFAAQDVMKHPEWPSALKTAFMTTMDGPMARSLREVLRKAQCDWALPDFAMNAKSGFVRAVATETLLEGRTRWVEGFDWEWHDKVFNIRRRVPIWEQRVVGVSSDTRAMVLHAACYDKGAKVRGLAADYLIKLGPSGNDSLVATLSADKSKSVQERMAFYQKK